MIRRLIDQFIKELMGSTEVSGVKYDKQNCALK